MVTTLGHPAENEGYARMVVVVRSFPSFTITPPPLLSFVGKVRLIAQPPSQGINHPVCLQVQSDPFVRTNVSSMLHEHKPVHAFRLCHVKHSRLVGRLARYRA